VQVFIRRGELITGCLCKKSLGTAGGGLVHVTWMEHGPDGTRRLINNIQ
jgi:DNA-directed RNA polymerase II subunit RPB1